VLKANPNLYQTIIISGHADSLESPSHAESLSRRRAKAVADYLIKNGMNPSLLKIEAWGDSRPKATNETKEGRAINRRVDFEEKMAPTTETSSSSSP